MKKRVLTLLTVLVIVSLAATPVAAAKSPKPGDPILFKQKIPINLVFVGYDQDQLDEAALLDQLPKTYSPIVRYPPVYGLAGRDLGLEYTFEYHIICADERFQNKFFKYLAKAGQPGDLTVFQQGYNDQDSNVLDVTGPVLYIDGPSTEKWLANNARSLLHIDTQRSYTVFFINWYNRDDFQFHVYTKTDQPDPDTGYNFGEIRDSRKTIAWGGTHSRTWFYDLSAGPEAWTNAGDVDFPDLDDNGVEDYRMPPIWEYTAGGYRDPSALSSDLGLVTRFVGIDLLFTTSPLYDPLVTTPGLGGDKVTHVEVFEDDPASNGLDWIDTRYVRRELRSFEPYYRWQVHVEDNNPIDAGAKRALDIFADLLPEDDCWTDFGTTFAQMFCYFDANLGNYVPDYDAADYVGEIFAFNTLDDSLGSQSGLLGFADDNWADGTQTYVFEFDTPGYRESGYGFSTTTVHEFGHHIGMSHPHDGYDSELDLDFEPADEFYFAWSGDESHTIMSYIDLSINFGQFDRDNMYRWEFAGYLNWANGLLDDILAHPKAHRVRSLLNSAESERRQAVHAFEAWNYGPAAQHAYKAYTLIATAAHQLGIATPSDAANLLARLPNAQVPHEGDPIRFPDN